MQQVITELLAFQGEIEAIKGRPLSDAEFCRHYLPFSESTWSRLKRDDYGASPTRLLAKARQALEELPGRIEALRRAQDAESDFRLTTLARAVIASVSAARDSGCRRIVPVLAPSGWGKTAIGDYYAGRGAIKIDGRQAWRASYKAFCGDVCEAAGPALPRTASEAHAEAEMIRRLRVKGAVVLYIDEANTGGPGFANALKQIHDKTLATVVVAAIPALWDKFVARAEEEVRQVINRCQPVIRASRILPADARLFLSGRGLPPAAAEKIVPAALEVAHTMGGIKALQSIADALRDIENPTLADAEAAIEAERRNIIASGIPARIQTTKQ